MKTIGLLGGMSYESTTTYYHLINTQIQKKLGESHSAKILLYSFDYYELEILLNEQKWDIILGMLVEQGIKLKQAGAELLALCANTMHILANEVEKQVGLPLIHIAEATALEIKNDHIENVLLLGTKYTMQSLLYPELLAKHQLKTHLPNDKEQDYIHHTIYDELIKGVYQSTSKHQFISIINKYKLLGIEGVILGCTEIPLLIKKGDIDIKRYDTLEIHINAIVKAMLSLS